MKQYNNSSSIIGVYKGIPLERYNPSENEVIVVRYNPNNFPLEEGYSLYQSLHQIFPDTKILFLRQDIALKQMSIEKLKELLDSIYENIVQS